MKKVISILLCLCCITSFFCFNANAAEYEEIKPNIVDFTVKTNLDNVYLNESNTRATGLINSYSLSLSKTNSTLNISGLTNASTQVVRCGFKNLTVERRKTSSDSWQDYYEYGDVYIDHSTAVLSTTLVVESGYQYRISCKHYAKKNLLSTQTIANTSNIVNV